MAAFDPPTEILYPNHWTCPIIFTSPHSGSIYPESFLARSQQSLKSLRRNEDALIDKLFASVTNHGAPLLKARFPRCFVDVNRAEDELPQKWLKRNQVATARAEIGLGVIPEIIAEDKPIYKRGLKPSIIEARLDMLYRPYHAALVKLIETSKMLFGHAIIIDCHSMPGFSPMGTRRADIILGDRYGTSCHSETTDLIHNLFAAHGYGVTRNYPYAGSHVTSHYGRPEDGVQTIQIEINRDLYLNPDTYEPMRGYKTLSENIDAIINDIVAFMTSPRQIAAE